MDRSVKQNASSESGKFVPRIPQGDNRERMTCSDCGFIHYENPRIICTALCVWRRKILLCRRAIMPRYGYWTLPGGFMEIGETPAEGAAREVREEACADVQTTDLLAVYSVPRIGQVHMVYLANLEKAEWACGSESLDVDLFAPEEDRIPWDDLAFPVNRWALRDYLSLNGNRPGRPFELRPEDRSERMSPETFHPQFPPPADVQR